MIIIERDRRLSDSIIWALTRDYYSQLGSDVWRRVPSVVTTHAAMARTYLKLALAWAGERPLVVMEIGGGSGRFAHAFLHQAARVPLRYVFTDFAQKNVDAARAHPALARDSRAAYARFDLTAPDAVTALPDNAAVVVLANYVFDSLPHDFFRVRNGTLEEGLVTLCKKDGTLSAFGLGHEMASTSLTYGYEQAKRPRYAESELEAVLESHTRLGTVEPGFLLPTASARGLLQLRQTLGVPFLLLSADKAWVDPHEMPSEPKFSSHDSVSVMTNFHALGEVAKACGGEALLHPPNSAWLSFCALVFGAPATAPLRACFNEEILERSPYDAAVLAFFGPDAPEGATLEWYWATLRMTGCDPRALITHAPGIRALKNRASRWDKRDLGAIVRRAASLFFLTTEDEQFLSVAARLLIAFGLEDEIEPAFTPVKAIYGSHIDLARIVARAQKDEAPLAEMDLVAKTAPPVLRDQAATLEEAQGLLMKLQMRRSWDR